ncbi:MAG: outer membrane protein assembly factor BamA [Candidatus Ratteibacteria bacterium]
MQWFLQKKLLFLLLISGIFLSGLYSAPLKVSKITVDGNKSVSTARILLMFKTKIGEELNSDLWRKDLDALSALPYFSDISFEIQEEGDMAVIHLVLKENPKIAGIELLGNRSLKKRDLEKAFGLRAGDFYTAEGVEKALEEIKDLYTKKGFFFLETSSDIISLPDETVTVRITIREGRRVAVSSLKFEGLTVFPERTIRKKLKTKARSFPFLRGTYKPELFEQDLATIKTFYANNGYPDCVVDHREQRQGNRLVVTIVIVEGEKILFGKSDFSGELLFDKEAHIQSLLYQEGDPFSQEKFSEGLKNLQRLYFDSGHIAATIVPVPTKRGSEMDYLYQISSGKIFTIDEVRILGNTVTKDKVIRREISLAPGDIFSGTKVQQSFNRLRDLQYFEKVDIYPKSSGESLADLIVDVKENERTGLFVVGGGYSSLENLLGYVSVEQRNFDIKNWPSFRGAGQNLKLWLQFGKTSTGFNISFTEPWFFDRPVSFGTDLFNNTYEWNEYKERHTGGALRLRRRWENISIGARVRSEEIKLSNIIIPEFKPQEGKKDLNSLTLDFIYQELDRVILPTKGEKFRIALEYAGGPWGGDIDFTKWSLENNYYLPLGKTVLHSKTYFGLVKEMGSSSEVPLYERFYGGGIGSVRGYKERSLGRRDVLGNELGGKTIFAQNLELLYPVYEDILWGVLFFDIGNVWEKWDGLSDLKKGAGVGIRIRAPFFPVPIQLDYGWPIEPDPGRGGGRLHIGMSMGF